jgi:hypothetical protein
MANPLMLNNNGFFRFNRFKANAAANKFHFCGFPPPTFQVVTDACLLLSLANSATSVVTNLRHG